MRCGVLPRSLKQARLPQSRGGRSWLCPEEFVTIDRHHDDLCVRDSQGRSVASIDFAVLCELGNDLLHVHAAEASLVLSGGGKGRQSGKVSPPGAACEPAHAARYFNCAQ